MHNREKTHAEQAALQTRIQELELENARLSKELKERKSLDYPLWKSKAEYHYLELFEYSDQPWGIGFPDRRLGYVNSAFERLVGYSKKELESIDWMETLTPPEWRRVEQEKLEELLKTDVPVRYEKEYIGKDGRRVPIELFVHLFRDGKFTPRWTFWLAVLLLPLTFLIAFDIDIVLNPNHWSGPLYLVPNILFVGGALYSVIYRYRHMENIDQKRALRWYVWGISSLVVVYFINLLMTDIYYWIAGQSLFQGNSAGLTYVLLNEPIWFACEAFFAVGVALSVFGNHLLEEK